MERTMVVIMNLGILEDKKVNLSCIGRLERLSAAEG
jgi:hypothetical protein